MPTGGWWFYRKFYPQTKPINRDSPHRHEKRPAKAPPPRGGLRRRGRLDGGEGVLLITYDI